MAVALLLALRPVAAVLVLAVGLLLLALVALVPGAVRRLLLPPVLLLLTAVLGGRRGAVAVAALVVGAEPRGAAAAAAARVGVTSVAVELALGGEEGEGGERGGQWCGGLRGSGTGRRTRRNG